jgi:hypothetical protein
MVLGSAVASGQKLSSVSWCYPGGGYETGKMAELKDKHKVYLSFFEGIAFPEEPSRTGLRQRILKQLTRQQTLEVVENPEAAELAVYISSSSTGAWDFYVLTRGGMEKDGYYKPRVVVKKLRSDSRDSTLVIEQAVSTFVDDLRAVRGQSN